jgi:hypothetical protein
MDDTFYDVRGDSFHVDRVPNIPIVHNDDHTDQEGKKRHSGPDHHEKRNPGAYMHTIARAAKNSNEVLAKKGSPYRFCVYEEKGNVMIDLVMLDGAGKVVKEVRRNITDDDFDKLINNIASIEGLLFDSNG